MDEPLATGAAAVGAVEDREVFILERRSLFDGLCATDVLVGFADLFLGESKSTKQVESGFLLLILGETETLHAFLAERPW